MGGGEILWWCRGISPTRMAHHWRRLGTSCPFSGPQPCWHVHRPTYGWEFVWFQFRRVLPKTMLSASYRRLDNCNALKVICLDFNPNQYVSSKVIARWHSLQATSFVGEYAVAKELRNRIVSATATMQNRTFSNDVCSPGTPLYTLPTTFVALLINTKKLP